MELLILKCDHQYIRVKGDAYHICGIDKASVYPLERLPAVRHHAAALQALGFSKVAIRKLVLTEKPLEEDA